MYLRKHGDSSTQREIERVILDERKQRFCAEDWMENVTLPFNTARSVHTGRAAFVFRQVVFLPHDIQTIKNTTICAGLHLGTLHKY